jgi:prolyl-tRNA synthetase
VIKGVKSETEKFAGAQMSTSIEAMMGDKRALQSATSHFFGENFARAFDIQYLDKNNTLQYCHTTSWGLSTRMIGAIIMVHGDDQGLKLPPKIAPIQVVLVPIYKNEEEKMSVMEVADRAFAELKEAGIRIKMDDREEVTPGFKYHDWEMRGVPLRIEVGPKDVEKGSVALARRDVLGREGKSFSPDTHLAQTVSQLLDEIQESMLRQAAEFRDANIHDPKDYEELKEVVKNGWAYSWWDGSQECEAKVKADTKATTRVIPFDDAQGKPSEQPEGATLTGTSGKCIVCGGKAEKKVYFARAY